jgi:hypothetical protein
MGGQNRNKLLYCITFTKDFSDFIAQYFMQVTGVKANISNK